MIVISAVLLLIFLILNIILKLDTKFHLLLNSKNIFNLVIILIIMFVIYNQYEEVANKIRYDEKRIERDQIIKILENKDLEKFKNSNLLTFDTKIMTWAIINDFRNITILDGTFSPKNNSKTEIDLIHVFKFFNLKKENFYDFLKNKRKGYRLINTDARKIFWQKYQANSLFTFNNSKNFNKKDLDFIRNSSPFYVHQFAIPNEEIDRLLSLYDKNQTFINYEPDIIILDKEDEFLNGYKIDNKKFCILFEKKKFLLYALKKYC